MFAESFLLISHLNAVGFLSEWAIYLSSIERYWFGPCTPCSFRGDQALDRPMTTDLNRINHIYKKSSQKCHIMNHFNAVFLMQIFALCVLYKE